MWWRASTAEGRRIPAVRRGDQLRACASSPVRGGYRTGTDQNDATSPTATPPISSWQARRSDCDTASRAVEGVGRFGKGPTPGRMAETATGERRTLHTHRTCTARVRCASRSAAHTQLFGGSFGVRRRALAVDPYERGTRRRYAVIATVGWRRVVPAAELGGSVDAPEDRGVQQTQPADDRHRLPGSASRALGSPRVHLRADGSARSSRSAALLATLPPTPPADRSEVGQLANLFR